MFSQVKVQEYILIAGLVASIVYEIMRVAR